MSTKAKKNLHAVALGALGGKARAKKLSAEALSEQGRIAGLSGGAARANSLSPQKRKAIAKKAAEARWKKTETK